MRCARTARSSSRSFRWSPPASNTSMFERVATEKMIQSGEMVILDIGSVVKGYTGDLGAR